MVHVSRSGNEPKKFYSVLKILKILEWFSGVKMNLV
jgi:hypothetical protein